MRLYDGRELNKDESEVYWLCSNLRLTCYANGDNQRRKPYFDYLYGLEVEQNQRALSRFHATFISKAQKLGFWIGVLMGMFTPLFFPILAIPVVYWLNSVTFRNLIQSEAYILDPSSKARLVMWTMNKAFWYAMYGAIGVWIACGMFLGIFYYLFK